jgi:PhzF family phenazine biosynthesis protein
MLKCLLENLLNRKVVMKIYTVDAFVRHSQQPFTGNPAAVAIVEDFPSDSVCQKIAAEMNLSETAFAKQLSHDHYHIRWFTPKVEVKLCGHATLATAHILFSEKNISVPTLFFESQSGILKATKALNGITLDFPLQKTGPAREISTFQEIIPLSILAVETAHDDVIIEVADEAALRNAQIDVSQLANIDCRGIIITARSTGEYDFISRFFAPKVGVNEDPVTGSAHCKLADYWQKKLGKKQFHAFQASSRGGELLLEINDNRVLMTGQAVTILRGELEHALI